MLHSCKFPLLQTTLNVSASSLVGWLLIYFKYTRWEEFCAAFSQKLYFSCFRLRFSDSIPQCNYYRLSHCSCSWTYNWSHSILNQVNHDFGMDRAGILYLCNGNLVFLLQMLCKMSPLYYYGHTSHCPLRFLAYWLIVCSYPQFPQRCFLKLVYHLTKYWRILHYWWFLLYGLVCRCLFLWMLYFHLLFKIMQVWAGGPIKSYSLSLCQFCFAVIFWLTWCSPLGTTMRSSAYCVTSVKESVISISGSFTRTFKILGQITDPCGFSGLWVVGVLL